MPVPLPVLIPGGHRPLLRCLLVKGVLSNGLLVNGCPATGSRLTASLFFEVSIVVRSLVIVIAFGPEPLPEPARKLVISNPQNEKKHMRFIKNRNCFDDTP